MRQSQSGNAIVYILIGIALFGALAYTFMHGAKTGQGNLTANQASIAAVEIIDYSARVGRTVNKLRQRGCSEKEINFDNSLETHHINPYARASGECDVFGAAGGNLTPMAIPSSWIYSGHSFDDIFFYSGEDVIDGIGTTCTNASCADLTLAIWGVTKELCDALNNKLGQSFATIPSSSLVGDAYKGDFEYNSIVFTDPLLTGKNAVCYNDTGYNTYTYLSIIMAR